MKYIGYFFVAFSLCTLVAIFKNCKQSIGLIKSSNSVQEINKRTDIVFIMGTDEEDEGTGFYELASRYYAQAHPQHKQIKNLRSVAEIRDYLSSSTEQLAYGNIYLVVHGNPWTGLNMSIFPEGDRINKDNLGHLLAQQTFAPVPNDYVDDLTTIHLEACGLGNDPLLLHQLSRALGGEDFQVPLVKASKHFISFVQQPGQSGNVHKYYAQPYFTFFPTAKKPALYHLKKTLAKAYPAANINWMQALTRPKNAPGFLPYYQQFNVPVNWTSVFLDETELPVTEHMDRQMELDWIDTQEELVAAVNKTGVPLDKFRWLFEPTKYLLESGEKLPALEIKGKTTVLCILQPIEIVPLTEMANNAHGDAPPQHFGFSNLDAWTTVD